MSRRGNNPARARRTQRRNAERTARGRIAQGRTVMQVPADIQALARRDGGRR